MGRTIMYVEDEKFARESFADYLKVRKKYDVRVYETALEAEKALENFKPDVIISDQKLGEESLGWEFLKKSILLSPYSVRFILSGYSEEEMVSHSFQEGIIFDYLSKSESLDEIVKKIENAFSFLELFKNNDQTNKPFPENLPLNCYYVMLREFKVMKDQLAHKEQEIQKLMSLAEQNKK